MKEYEIERCYLDGRGNKIDKVNLYDFGGAVKWAKSRLKSDRDLHSVEIRNGDHKVTIERI